MTIWTTKKKLQQHHSPAGSFSTMSGAVLHTRPLHTATRPGYSNLLTTLLQLPTNRFASLRHSNAATHPGCGCLTRLQPFKVLTRHAPGKVTPLAIRCCQVQIQSPDSGRRCSQNASPSLPTGYHSTLCTGSTSLHILPPA